MSEPITLVVVALIASDDDSVANIPEDLDELSAYELGIRRRVGRAVPSPVMICLESQEELKELMDSIADMDVTLDLLTDDRTQPKPATLDDLWSLLPKIPPRQPVDSFNVDDPLRILPNGSTDPSTNPPEDDNPLRILE